MKRTVDEKLQYNSGQHTPFSYGYRFGVMAYRKYPKASKERKREMIDEIDNNSRLARSGKISLNSVQYAKGFMCAMRDCAAERKARQKGK